MQAELKSWDTGSADYDPESYKPADPESFEIWITASIGAVGGEGADLFQFRVTTPRYLASTQTKGAAEWALHTLLVDRYDPVTVKAALLKFLARCNGDNWEAIAVKIGQIAHWEFESYKP